MATVRKSLSLDEGAWGYIESAGGARGASAFTSRVALRMQREERNALRVLLALGWTAGETQAALSALQATHYVGSVEAEAVAGELHDAAALYQGEEKLHVAFGIDGDAWKRRVAEVRENADLAVALVRLAQLIEDGSESALAAVKRLNGK